jgi:hypothetical protein
MSFKMGPVVRATALREVAAADPHVPLPLIRHGR